MVRSIPRVGTREGFGFVACLLLVAGIATGRDKPDRPAVGATDTAEPRKTPAEFTLLTYNIAGLPGLLSQSDPAQNTPAIGELLNFYDVAILQEDFAYHGELSLSARHPFRSEPLPPGPHVGLGDGLNRFSRVPFGRFFRSAWRQCHGQLGDGADCLTAKGFSVAEHQVESGVSVDVYNLHMDAGESEGDSRTRQAQWVQLLDFMGRWSPGKPVIVAGDTNMLEPEDAAYERLLLDAGLLDACRQLGCPERHSLDRVLFRSSRTVRLEPKRFGVDGRFVRSDGQDLSDHKAVGVVFRWTRQSPSSRPPSDGAPTTRPIAGLR